MGLVQEASKSQKTELFGETTYVLYSSLYIDFWLV